MLLRLVAVSWVCVLVAFTASAAEPEQVLLDKLSGEKPITKGEFKYVRTAFASYFAEKFADEIQAAFGNDRAAIVAWLDKNPDIRDTLYTAIDPDVDDVTAALKLFCELYKLGPDKLKDHANLAVAIAVTWDQPKAIYDYTQHQRRTKSTLPAEVATTAAKENYEYFLQSEKQLKGSVQQLPWEFLVHVVNHRTPTAERQWAAKNYLFRRAGIGTTFKDIQYDYEMLRTESAVCKLGGSAYTLENIRKLGGVCAMQADFAARVSKSLQVPAEYVGGEGNSGVLHAWVMWVEVRSVQADRVDFALMSEGRYLIDQYYIGNLLDPKSGKTITDRDLERRLSTIGYAPQAARHADLLLRAYPTLRDRKALPIERQRRFLEGVLAIFPHADRAWIELSALYKDGKLKDAEEAVRLADKCLTTFAKFPDFSQKLLPELLTPVTDKGIRTRMFEKAVLGYEGLGRPDLACETRLVLVELQAEAGDHKKAADGLAQTIRKFPSEGRYVPKMMERMQTVCEKFKGGNDQLAKFYLELLPKVPPRRGDLVSTYSVKLHEQAVTFLTAQNKPKEAELVERWLRAVRGK